MEGFLVTLVSALVATMVMTSLMYALVWDGFQHGDTIRALGTEATHEPGRKFPAGVSLYLASGLMLSGVYWIAYKFFAFDSVVIALFLAGGMGFVQGFLFMHFYVAEVGLHHPFAQFNKHWLPLPFAHWVCHLLFGLSIGSMLGAFLVHGLPEFALSVVLNLLLVAIIVFFARKNEIVSTARERQRGR